MHILGQFMFICAMKLCILNCYFFSIHIGNAYTSHQLYNDNLCETKMEVMLLIYNLRHIVLLHVRH